MPSFATWPCNKKQKKIIQNLFQTYFFINYLINNNHGKQKYTYKYKLKTITKCGHKKLTCTSNWMKVKEQARKLLKLFPYK